MNFSPWGFGMKICVNAIAKNEAQFVPRFCESAKDADLILIADTGSTYGLVEVARSHGAVVHEICVTPWRFDVARNTALALVPKDFDVVISLDIDEVLMPGWRAEIERVWKPETTRLRYFFDWGCDIKFKYEKIFARHGYRWHHPVHEYPVPDPRVKEVWADTDMLLVKHLPDNTKSRGQYLELLKMSVEEDPACPRNAFYYARELTFYQKWGEAVVALLKYLDNPKANWINERAYAMRLLGKSYAHLGCEDQALEWHKKAVQESPGTREPWVDLAQFYYGQRNWAECLACIESCLAIKDRELIYTCDPAVWGSLPYDLGAIALWHLNEKEKAIVFTNKALEYDPESERLKANLAMMKGLNDVGPRASSDTEGQ
jgi:glycosyltransferase involved in cell wall biosynthesis